MQTNQLLFSCKNFEFGHKSRFISLRLSLSLWRMAKDYDWQNVWQNRRRAFNWAAPNSS